MSKTHFGFQSVDETEKARHVRGVFDSVAPKYDLMNDLMSGGLHRAWKAYTVMVANLKPGQRALDIAGGTGVHHFRKAQPHRFFQFGIAEQNMMAAAGGMAALLKFHRRVGMAMISLPLGCPCVTLYTLILTSLAPSGSERESKSSHAMVLSADTLN